MRIIVLTAVFAAAAAGGASAQYYPPSPFYPPASYRGGPPPMPTNDEADNGYAAPQRPQGRATMQGAPYPYEAPPGPGPGYFDRQAPGFLPPPPPQRGAYNEPYQQGYQSLRPPGDVPGAAPYQGSDYTGAVRGPDYGSNPPPARGQVNGAYAALPPEDQPEQGAGKELPERFRKQVVDFPTSEPAGTIVIDTSNTYLYLVQGGGKAMRYGIGVGRDGFTWAGREKVSRMAEWPDWHPPKEMIERQPYLPRFMAGGASNPLGARALYLGSTVYRIHGTNQPSTIGSFVSSGCIRLVNADVEDLYQRVTVGTKVVVLPGGGPANRAADASGTVVR